MYYFVFTFFYACAYTFYTRDTADKYTKKIVELLITLAVYRFIL